MVKELCDFSRSFATFRIDTEKEGGITISQKPPFRVNNCRAPVECRLSLSGRHISGNHEFYLLAACKSEQVNVQEGIWHQPNADVSLIIGAAYTMILKCWDHCDRRIMLHPESLGPQPPRQVVSNEQAFDRVTVHTPMRPVRQLTTDEVIDAVLSHRPLVSRTIIGNDTFEAVIDYPVKLINVGERDHFYQVDTGPILLPDLNRPPEEKDLIAGLELAYIGHNAPDWSEWIVRVPTPVQDAVKVWHYSHSVRYRTQNTLYQYED